MSNLFQTPEDCVAFLKQSFSIENAKDLLIALDNLVVSYKFKLFKMNGNKKYAYFQCFKSGNRDSSKNDEEKQRKKISQKTSKIFLFISHFLDCPFRISYIFNEEKQIYEFNETKSNFAHNHILDYNGLSKDAKNQVANFMEKKELEEHIKPTAMKKQSEAFLEGIEQAKVTIPAKQNFYLHSKIKQKIWGAKSKDAAQLQSLMLQVKSQFPNSLFEIEADSQNQLKNVVFSSPKMKELFLKFDDVLLMDTTFKTNKYNMSLLVIAGVNEEAKTFLIGFGALRNEETQNMQWVLSKLFHFLEKRPQIICTDSCPTLSKVIKELTPESTHLLCGWHVSQNIKRHLSGLSKFSLRNYHYFRTIPE